MCAKVLPSPTDEASDLRKQVGCMNGIFQLFDCHHFPTRRRFISQNHKRLLPGAQPSMEPRHATKKEMGNDPEVPKDSRVSFESSRASYSSSSCSSLISSFDSNRTAQPEVLPLTQTSFQATITREQNTSFPRGQQSLDLRDLVKDLMYREPRGLSIKSKANNEKRGSVLKHIDSPRPCQQLKGGQSRVTARDGSIQHVDKLQEATKKYNHEQLALPRFSYDERESRDRSKSTIHRRELPRLSLDSKASTMKISALQCRSNFLLSDLHMGNENYSQTLPSDSEPESNKTSSNVVAKLMGLETFSHVISTGESTITKIKSYAKIDSASSSQKIADNKKHTQNHCSPRVLQKGPASPQLGNANSVLKPTSRLRFPPEPAPWKQPDNSQDSRKQALKSRKSSAMIPNLSSVYGEIEKRITELGFEKSGKDLAALKHMLEVMEKTRQTLVNRKVDLNESATQTSTYSAEKSIHDADLRISKRRDRRSKSQVPTTKGTPPKRPEPSIMIVKPTNRVDKVRISSSSQVPSPDTSHLRNLRTRVSTDIPGNSGHKHPEKDLTPRNNLNDSSCQMHSADRETSWRTPEARQTSKAPRCNRLKSCATPGSYGMVSQRIKQKKQEKDRQSHATIPLSDSDMIERRGSKQAVSSHYPNGKLHQKSNNLQQGIDPLCECRGDMGYSSYHDDTASVMSEDSTSIVSQTQSLIISLPHSIEMNTKPKNEPKFRDSAARSRDHVPTVEITTMLEQPSPVSVLDASFCRDDPPSPVKKISTAFRDGESSDFHKAEWRLKNFNGLPDDKGFHANIHRKLDMSETLFHKLRILNSTPCEATLNQAGFMYESPNPDLQYITKMLLASGLLIDVTSVPIVDHHHSPYHLIDPALFDVLEQTEQNMKLEDEELDEEKARLKFNQKIHRKIVFDTVNEILVQKLASQGSFALRRKKLKREDLPKVVHIELNRLLRKRGCSHDDCDDGFVRMEDITNQSADWMEYTSEIPALVLDIERLIFKDLINEVVNGEALGLYLPSNFAKF